jgi:hypothetical protein
MSVPIPNERRLVAPGIPIRMIHAGGKARRVALSTLAKLFGDDPATETLFREPDADDPLAFGALPREALGYVECREGVVHAGKPSTRRVYSQHWQVWLHWCAKWDVRPLPAHPEAVRMFLLEALREGRALKTIEVRISAVASAHRGSDLPVPTSTRLAQTLEALRRGLGLRIQPSVDAATLRKIVAACNRDLKSDLYAVRDRALILLVHAARLDRIVATALRVEDVERVGARLVVQVTATDRRWVDPQDDPDLCPVRAFTAWVAFRVAHGAAASGPLFCGLHRGRKGRVICGKKLHPSDVNRLLEKRSDEAGLPRTAVRPQNLRAEMRRSV